MTQPLSDTTDAYRISRPAAQTVPFVFDSPHSGNVYPLNFGYACDIGLLRSTEDIFVDELYAGMPLRGAPLLAAAVARNYIDVNRAEDDIDPDLLDGQWPDEHMPSIRSAAGHGVVHRLVKSGFPIYGRRLSVAEIKSRIAAYYRPYHAALKTLIDETHYKFGQVFHVNCHSMNSLHAPHGSAFSGQQADFVLGDRDGTSCDPDFTNAVKDFLSGLGYKVFVNDPYKGVEIVQRYSDPRMGRNSLQIEINKALYLDEGTQAKSSNFNVLKSDIDRMGEFLAAWAETRILPLAAD
jgi:N-formylglutamate deformylase